MNTRAENSAKLPNSLPSKIWYCKIGEVPEEVLHREWPTGADSPMRDAVSEAFRQITGEPPMFIFSGWAAELTEYERAVVENREPDPEVIRADLQRELAILPSAEQSKDSPPEQRKGDELINALYADASELESLDVTAVSDTVALMRAAADRLAFLERAEQAFRPYSQEARP